MRKYLLLISLFALGTSVARAGPNPQALECGVTRTGELRSSPANLYTFNLEAGEAVSIEMLDVSCPEVGDVGYRLFDSLGEIDSGCGFGMEVVSDETESFRLEIFRCTDADAILCPDSGANPLAITLSSISETLNGEAGCGERLSCQNNAFSAEFPDRFVGMLGASGSIDSYRFTLDSRSDITISASEMSSTIGALEMRLYDKNGDFEDGTCEGTIEARRLQPGTYTLLLNDCIGAQSGTYRLAFDTEACSKTVSNDLCIGATPLEGSSSLNVSSTEMATESPDDPVPSCGDGQRNRNLWYRFLAPANGIFEVDTLGSTYDTVLSAYSGSCGALTPISQACNDDLDSGIFQSRVFIPAIAGETYFVAASSFENVSGLLALGHTFDGPTTAPTATPTPTSPTVTPTMSSTALLTMTATPVLGCIGDCDASSDVTVDEIVAGVNIALGNREFSVCPAFDRNGDVMVSVDEVIAAIANALGGCV